MKTHWAIVQTAFNLLVGRKIYGLSFIMIKLSYDTSYLVSSSMHNAQKLGNLLIL